MKSETIINDNSNNMNIDMPFGSYIPTLLNSFNLTLGFIASSDINMLSAIFGFVLSGMWQLYRLYRQIKADSQADAMAPSSTRLCVECKTVFEPAHINQIFCKDECTESFLNNPSRRKTARKKVKIDE